MFRHGEVRDSWYYNWLRRYRERLGTAAPKPLEVDRERWTTKLNVQDMVRTMFGTDIREEFVDPKTQTTRLTSSTLWDKGPITSDVCFALVRTAAEKREAKEDEDASKRQAREDEMASKKQDACVLASTLTTGLTCAEDVHKLTVEQLGAILLSHNDKKPKGKAAMVEAVVTCLGLPPVADGARTQEWLESLQAAVDYFASRGLSRDSNPRGTRRRGIRNVRKVFRQLSAISVRFYVKIIH